MAATDSIRGIAKVPAPRSAGQPTMRHAKADDRGDGVTSARLVDHAAALAAGDAMLNIPRLGTDVAASEHYHTGGSAGAPGECSATCACGVTFDGFDTTAEAGALLDRHIADPEPDDVKPEAIADHVEDWVRSSLNARYDQAAAELTAVSSSNQTAAAMISEAMQALVSRLTSTPMPDLCRVVMEAAQDETMPAIKKASFICDQVRAALVGPCPAWCVVPVEKHIADAGGFSPWHEAEVMTVREPSAATAGEDVVNVRVMRLDTYGVPGLARVEVTPQSEFTELSPEAVDELIDRLAVAKKVADADRVVVAAGAR